MKMCSSCKIEKPLESFQKRSRNKDGHSNLCKECKRAYDNKYYENNENRKQYIKDNRKKSYYNVKKYIYEYLLDHPCVDCGETDVVVLEFDHIEDDKKSEVSTLRRSSLRAVKNEIKKCQVRCANCHRRKTAKQFGWTRSPL